MTIIAQRLSLTFLIPGGVTSALDDRHGGADRGGVLPAGEGVGRGEAGQQVFQ